MPPSESSPQRHLTQRTIWATFSETELLAGSYLGQNATIGQSCSNPQVIPKNCRSSLQNSCCLASGMSWTGLHQPQLPHLTLSGSAEFMSHQSVLMNLLPSVGDLQEPGLGMSHHLHDLLQSCKGPNLPRLLQLPGYVFTLFHAVSRFSFLTRAGSVARLLWNDFLCSI